LDIAVVLLEIVAVIGLPVVAWFIVARFNRVMGDPISETESVADRALSYRLAWMLRTRAVVTVPVLLFMAWVAALVALLIRVTRS
jgi:hypothetical protein